MCINILRISCVQMKESGCCGADEFIKLYAYNLTEYHRVVHLDMDSIIYKNMVRPIYAPYVGDYDKKLYRA